MRLWWWLSNRVNLSSCSKCWAGLLRSFRCHAVWVLAKYCVLAPLFCCHSSDKETWCDEMSECCSRGFCRDRKCWCSRAVLAGRAFTVWLTDSVSSGGSCKFFSQFWAVQYVKRSFKAFELSPAPCIIVVVDPMLRYRRWLSLQAVVVAPWRVGSFSGYCFQ